MHEFAAEFLFCGLGAGARGFIEAGARLGTDQARFVNLGGIDNDPASCKDFTYLTGGRAHLADISTLTIAQHRQMIGDRRPDAIFLSPPCKGFSRLLSRASAAKKKYQDLNRLVLQGIFLACETWASPPPLIVIENVPGITTRGRDLLDQVRQVLSTYGYVFHASTHDCGEIGGLAQHRRRYLLVARRPQDVTNYVYRPPRRRVRGCGEVLGELPMPEDPEAGELHKLPNLSWLNWVRLSLIPAGGDWRDLPGMTPKIGLAKTATGAASFKGRPGLFGVADWKEPISTVTGTARVGTSNAVAAVADPRTELAEELCSPLKPGQERRAIFGKYDVRPWEDPARTVTGDGSNGGFGVADPRVGALEHEPWRGALGIVPWDEPAPAVRGASSVRQSRSAVADPRIQLAENPGRHWNKYAVTPWEDPAPTVTGATRPGSGAPAAADPRPFDSGRMGVTPWTEPARTVTGESYPSNGGASVADPRLKCTPRNGAWGVMSWQEAAATVTGSASVDNGKCAVADPRVPKKGERAPVIVAADGTWHRPLTTLELAALQGIPSHVNGQPLKLAGNAVAKWRERIGNAVPVQAGTAIAETLLVALLATALGTWSLGSTGIWVRDDGRSEDEVNAEFEQVAA